jgi:monoamine oxidase
LLEADIDVAVLEARERLGGRIWTHRDSETSVPIELGAEFIHGRAPELQRVLDEAGLSSTDISGRRWEATPRGLRPLDDFWERLDRVMRKLKHADGGDISFDRFVAGRPGGRRLARDRRFAREFVENFHAADTTFISARALADGGSPGEDVRERRLARVADGYDGVVEWLAAPLAGRITMASVVSRVEWATGGVAVHVRAPDDRTRLAVEARAAIVAVPLGVLKASPHQFGGIEFVPALARKRHALDQLEMGSAVRVALRFRERFWASEEFAKAVGPHDVDTLSFLHATDQDFPVWWTTYPARVPVMVAWRGGPHARALTRMRPPDIEDRAIAALARVLGISRRRVQSMVDCAWMHDWDNDPFARGAYSYQRVGGADAPLALSRPVRRTLFFAGEATGSETGTVEAAIATGRRAARQAMRALE